MERRGWILGSAGALGAMALVGAPLRLAAATAAPGATAAATPAADTPDAIAERLRQGGVVIAFRHALAPGTFDPPGFLPGVCSTQRNLSDEGRAQARRLGAWFQQRQLAASAVRSSPWCRCLDTATLAFGRAESWPALGSPRGTEERTYATQITALRSALSAVPAGRFEVWVTHMFVLADLVGGNTTSGEGLLLQATAEGPPRVLGRLLVG
jgi:phosphohistidine phosphatase SixA